MFETCIALVIERVSGCSLGWKFWWFKGVGALQVLPGLKGDELQKMLFWLGGDWESFLLDKGDERTKRDSRWDPRILDEWKVKAEALLKLKVQKTSSSHPHLLSI